MRDSRALGGLHSMMVLCSFFRDFQGGIKRKPRTLVGAPREAYIETSSKKSEAYTHTISENHARL